MLHRDEPIFVHCFISWLYSRVNFFVQLFVLNWLKMRNFWFFFIYFKCTPCRIIGSPVQQPVVARGPENESKAAPFLIEKFHRQLPHRKLVFSYPSFKIQKQRWFSPAVRHSLVRHRRQSRRRNSEKVKNLQSSFVEKFNHITNFQLKSSLESWFAVRNGLVVQKWFTFEIRSSI